MTNILLIYLFLLGFASCALNRNSIYESSGQVNGPPKPLPADQVNKNMRKLVEKRKYELEMSYHKKFKELEHHNETRGSPCEPQLDNSVLTDVCARSSIPNPRAVIYSFALQCHPVNKTCTCALGHPLPSIKERFNGERCLAFAGELCRDNEDCEGKMCTNSYRKPPPAGNPNYIYNDEESSDEEERICSFAPRRFGARPPTPNNRPNPQNYDQADPAGPNRSNLGPGNYDPSGLGQRRSNSPVLDTDDPADRQYPDSYDPSDPSGQRRPNLSPNNNYARNAQNNPNEGKGGNPDLPIDGSSTMRASLGLVCVQFLAMLEVTVGNY